MTDTSKMTLDQKVDFLIKEVSDIKSVVGRRFSWEETTTQSGIQLSGGPTTVTHYGHVLGFTSAQTHQGIAFAFILQDESNKKFAILSPDLVKPA